MLWSHVRSHRRGWAILALYAVAAAVGPAFADHRDGPVFEDTAARLDIGEVYVFRSPTNANNTVFTMTVSPFAGGPGGTPTTFQEDAVYDLKVATGNVFDLHDDLTFRVTFSAADASGVQDVLLRVLPAAKLGGTGVLAKGKTNQNLPVAGGGLFRAGYQDDPYFFDEVGHRQLLNGGAFPRLVGTAANRYGPNANILAIVLELPSSQVSATNSLIGVWARTAVNGVQQDRAARPLLAEGLVPPVPRGASFPIGMGGANRQERRGAYNAGHPKDDPTAFQADVVGVFQAFYGRTLVDANALTNLFLPDILIFQIGNPNGLGTFVADGTGGTPGTHLGNGRRLRDDVVDIMVNIISNGLDTTDNVPDDNGMRITDGNMGTVAAFPYIGAPNASPAGLP